jgi:hypothetical protein
MGFKRRVKLHTMNFRGRRAKDWQRDRIDRLEDSAQFCLPRGLPGQGFFERVSMLHLSKKERLLRPGADPYAMAQVFVRGSCTRGSYNASIVMCLSPCLSEGLVQLHDLKVFLE